MITGIQNAQGKCYTQPLPLPSYIRRSSPYATIHMFVDLALEIDESFLQDFNTAVHKKVHEFQEHQFVTFFLLLKLFLVMNLSKPTHLSIVSRQLQSGNFGTNVLDTSLMIQYRQLANLLMVFPNYLIVTMS